MEPMGTEMLRRSSHFLTPVSLTDNQNNVCLVGGPIQVNLLMSNFAFFGAHELHDNRAIRRYEYSSGRLPACLWQRNSLASKPPAPGRESTMIFGFPGMCFFRCSANMPGIFAVRAAETEADRQLDLLAGEIEILCLGGGGEHRRCAKCRA